MYKHLVQQNVKQKVQPNVQNILVDVADIS